MVKKVGWPWLVGVFFVGWIIGNSPPDVTPVREPASVTIVTKSDRVQNNKKQSVPIQARPLRTALPKKITLAPVPKPPEIPKPATPKKIMYVDASRLNVRDTPNKTGKQVWTLKRDEKVTVTNKKNEWLFVQGARYQGWVFGAYLTPNKSLALQQPPTSGAEISKPNLSSNKIRRILIERSISLYSGACPCPYNIMRNGRKCGRRSAYSRPGGASPLCYPRDIPEDKIAAYRARL